MAPPWPLDVASTVECAAAQAVVAAPRRQYQSVRELWERPTILLLADEDSNGELLLLGELGRHLVGLATVGGLKIVVDDMVDHIVCIIMDHLGIVYLVGDLAADTRTGRRRWRLSAVLVVLIVLIVLVRVVVEGGHDGLPVAVLVGIAEVAGAPV
jgi:hypothetical protein